MTAEYLVGRSFSTISQQTATYKDCIFPAHRYDEQTFTQLRFEHCTFANNSLKGALFDQCTFVNVVFVGVYFRDTVLKSCTFEGCKFIACDMTRVDIRSSSVRYYNSFSSTFVPFDRIENSLPREGNLRQQLCDNLSRESSNIGNYGDAGRFRAASMEGQLAFLKAVAVRRGDYYRQKYDLSDQIRHAARLVRVSIFNLIWGNTRSHWVVLRNWVLLAIIAFGYFAIFARPQVEGGVEWSQAGLFGALATVPITSPLSYDVSGWLPQTLLVAFRVLGLMFAAIFAALLFARAYEGRR